MKKNFVIIAAGGTGSRLNQGKGKQLLKLAKVPILVRSIRLFSSHPLISGIVVVIEAKDIAACQQLITDHELDKVVSVVASGDTRQKSILNGLSAIEHADNVLIHDGARPLLRPDLIDRVLEALESIDGAILGVPVVDTIKEVYRNVVVSTPDRSRLWAAQTPQGFRYDVLKRAYEQASVQPVTDDASLVEKIGGKVTVIEGDRENIKITYPLDIVVAEAILKKRAV